MYAVYFGRAIRLEGCLTQGWTDSIQTPPHRTVTPVNALHHSYLRGARPRCRSLNERPNACSSCCLAAPRALRRRPALIGQAQHAATSTYLTPPQAIVDILDVPPAPDVEVSPARDVLLLLERRSMPPLEELAQPMLRLAGERINPRTNGQHRTPGIIGISLQPIRGDAAHKVQLPASR
jgi:hypothetical protein